jgi:hypothetical protein
MGLDPLRLGRDAAAVADEVVSALNESSPERGSRSIEIQVLIPNGVPDDLVRTVTEKSPDFKVLHLRF